MNPKHTVASAVRAWKFILLLFAAAAAAHSGARAQEVLLEQSPPADSVVPRWGANRKHFIHSYIQYGLTAGPDSAGSEVIYGASYHTALGFRYKRRVCNFFAFGADLQYGTQVFRLKQDSAKFLPNERLHLKEKLAFHNLGSDVYLRFNFGRRGAHLGKFLDLGGGVNWVFSTVHFTKDTFAVATVNNGGTEKTRTTGLIYILPIHYYALVRAGYKRVALTAAYRLSPLFKADPELYRQFPGGRKYPELPLLNIGIEIDLSD